MRDPDQLILEANQRLHALGLSTVQIERRGKRLVLRATLPCRNGGPKPRQQRISLGLAAIPLRIPEAETAAQRLAQQLATGTFAWSSWGTTPEDDPAPAAPTREDATEWLRQRVAERIPDPQQRANSWRCYYSYALRRLPDGPLSGGALIRALQAMPYGSRPRYGCSQVFGLVADHYGWDGAAVRNAGRGYGVKALTPRDIPSDSEIETAWAKVHDRYPQAAYFFALGGCYGLRPSEMLSVEFDNDYNALVSPDTKTGQRLVWPVPPQWIERFGVLTPPPITLTKRHGLTTWAGYRLRRCDVTIRLYDLRHAFAVRLLRRGISADIGARLMGHSAQLHSHRYQRWCGAAEMRALRAQWMPAPPEDG